MQVHSLFLAAGAVALMLGLGLFMQVEPAPHMGGSAAALFPTRGM